MSIFGKLLIVFNLLAAGAFAYFTLNNWHLRQELTRESIVRQVRLDGLPVDKSANPPAELGPDRLPFEFQMPNGGPRYNSIPKEWQETLLPKGDDTFGASAGESILDQTAEVKRLQQKVAGTLPAFVEGQDPTNRFDYLRIYLLNLVRSGAERDGVNALFDLRLPERRDAAKRDLPYAARTSSQVAALQTIVEIASLGDPQAIMPEAAQTARVGLAREAVRRFLLAEVPHGVPYGTEKDEAIRKAAQDDAIRKLRDAVVDALRDKAGDGVKQPVIAAATADAAGWTELANLAVEPLATKPSIDKAITALSNYVQLKGTTETEKAALAGLKDLINPPPLGFVLDKAIDTVGTNLLNSKFDEAALPASNQTTNKDNPAGEKARKIAHLLYHVDAHRHANRDATVVANRKAWHERVATVVGLPAYIRAAEAQASEYAEAGQRLIVVITEEQSAFEAEFNTRLQKVLSLHSQWLVLDTQLKSQEAITKENVRLKEERLTERDKLLKDLEEATLAAKESLERLKKTQSQLFAIQRSLRDAQAAILSLEQELRRLELGDLASRN